VLLTAALVSGCQAHTAALAHLRGPPAQIVVVEGLILRTVLAKYPPLAHAFAGRTTYVAVSGPRRPFIPRPAGIIEPTVIYKSFAALARDLAAGKVPAFVHAVLYDPEKWAATPMAEQRNPRAYMVRFSELARAYGLIPILAPARDLVLVPGAACMKRTRENLTEAYIRCGLATADAHAAVLVVQSQIDQFNLPVYQHFLAVAARQARAANPRVAVVAELATAPGGRAATAAQLVAAARSVGGLVQGFSISARRADLQAAGGVLESFKQS
jgi:hypothetical protein